MSSEITKITGTNTTTSVPHYHTDDIITALNAIQMLSGFETPLLENPTVEIAYKGTGWILNLRAMMREYDMSLSIEHIRVPQRQRLYMTGRYWKRWQRQEDSRKRNNYWQPNSACG
eukprot:scaffold6172_cov42-Cyclotella_meneghiniana.AAC.2